MKTYKCTEAAAVAANLSYEEIQKEEGIYGIVGYVGSYLVIIRGCHGTVVLFAGDDRIEAPSTSWSTARFTKTDKKLHLEIR